mgnify:CR=1 FL=1
MLQFINEEDFLKVDTFTQNADSTVTWIYSVEKTEHSGDIYEGFIRKASKNVGTRTIVLGEDEEGNEVTQEEPIIESEEINVWDKLWELHNNPEVDVEVIPYDITPCIEEAKQRIDQLRDEHIASGVEFEGDLYQTKPTNVTDMMEAAVANRDTQWLTADNTVVAMPVTKLNELIQVVANKKELYIYKARQHKDNVLNLTTKEDIDDYMSNLTW